MLVLAAGAAIYAYYLWNKPPETAADKKPIAVLSADSLMSEFKYKGDQVIQVSGKITDVKIDSVTTLLLETQDIMGVISCTFAIDQPITKKIGDNIELKGICAGFNMDVELRQCVLVQ